MTTDSREAFEAWWMKQPVSEFDGVDAGHVWAAWQAARAATARECAELCESHGGWPAGECAARIRERFGVHPST